MGTVEQTVQPWREGRTPHLGRLGLAWCLVAALAAACSSKPPEAKGYVAQILAERAEKDAFFQKSDEPIPQNRKAELLPLSYFPVDPDYNVGASLKPEASDTVVSIQTSTGTPRQMRRVGELEFVLKGRPLKLAVFVEANAPNLDHLLVLFSDLTSGTETYAAGRYIDLNRNASGLYELDFNRAYQPYCYYNDSYECPYPPRENRLQIPIHAGERLKHPNT
jgi:uncharacterized protein (DUF1684 family)